jgi:DNA polymerase I-like protein with 3'-5' exonuclease and polymerase domains
LNINALTGVYCFDLWVREVRLSGIKIMFQYHDEIAFHLKETEQEIVRKKLLDSIERVNNIVKLNVPLGVSVDFGKDYSQIH